MPQRPVRDEVPCPDCAELVLRVAKTCKHCGSWLAEIHAADVETPTQDTRIPCPQCAELIFRDALQCSHCNSDLGEPDAVNRKTSTALPAEIVAAATEQGVLQIVRESSSLDTPLRTTIRIGDRLEYVREGERKLILLPFGEHVVTFQQLGLRDTSVGVSHEKGVQSTLRVRLTRGEGILVENLQL